MPLISLPQAPSKPRGPQLCSSPPFSPPAGLTLDLDPRNTILFKLCYPPASAASWASYSPFSYRCIRSFKPLHLFCRKSTCPQPCRPSPSLQRLLMLHPSSSENQCVLTDPRCSTQDSPYPRVPSNVHITLQARCPITDWIPDQGARQLALPTPLLTWIQWRNRRKMSHLVEGPKMSGPLPEAFNHARTVLIA